MKSLCGEWRKNDRRQATAAVLVAVSVELKVSEQQFVFLTRAHTHTYKHVRTVACCIHSGVIKVTVAAPATAVGNWEFRSFARRKCSWRSWVCVCVCLQASMWHCWHANGFWHCNWIRCFRLLLHSCYSWLSIAVAKALPLFSLSIASVFVNLHFWQFFYFSSISLSLMSCTAGGGSAERKRTMYKKKKLKTFFEELFS